MSVGLDPSGKFAYVGDVVSNNILMYTVDTASGALTSIGTIGAGMYPFPVVVDPSGRFAYVANGNSNGLGIYTVDATTGALTPAGTIAAGSLPDSLTITAVIQ
jgi:6-phosphogluconolactonase (cycloisomerase 2 family)